MSSIIIPTKFVKLVVFISEKLNQVRFDIIIEIFTVQGVL